MERGELTSIQRILNTLDSIGKLRGEHYTAAQQQYDNLHGKLMNLKKIFPQRYETIKSNALKKRSVINLSKINEDDRKKCPGLIQALDLAVKLKKDDDCSARRELMMLLDTDYLGAQSKQGGKKQETPPPGWTPGQTDPCTVRMTTLWEFLSDKQNMSALNISEQTAEQAKEEFQRLKQEWEEILNKEDQRVRSFLNSTDYVKKNSLSSMKVGEQDPLHKVMKKLSDSKKILSQKDDIIYEYVTLVNVCTKFRRHAAPISKDVSKKAPTREHQPKGATNENQTEERHHKSSEKIRHERSDLDQGSYLQTLLNTYWGDKDVDEDDKESSRQEFIKFMTLRQKYGSMVDPVSNDAPVKDGKLENIVTEDQSQVAKGLYTALRYAKEKGIEKWQRAAAEFSRLADFVKGLGKTDPEDLGARPKVPSEETKHHPLYQLISTWNKADSTVIRKALDQYRKLRKKVSELPDIRADHNLAQSLSRLHSPAEIPDDEKSSSYHVLQILRAADPDAKIYPAAWDEYFYLLAEEQRYIQIVIAQDGFKRQQLNREHRSKEQVFHVEAPNAQEPIPNQFQLPSCDQAGAMPSVVQAPCQRQPQRIAIQEGEIRMPYNQWHQVLEELDRKTQEVDELSSRLSRFASQQLTSGNPNIADLSDRNRPTKIGEMFGQLYDNEWSEAFDSLKTAFGNAAQESTSASLKSDKPGSKEKTTREKDHSLKVKSMRDVPNVQETVGQDDRLWKSQREASTRGDKNRPEVITLNTLNEAKGELTKEANSSFSSKGRRKNVAEGIISSVSASTSAEKGGEGDGVVSKQDNQSENSKDAAKKVCDDRKQGHCEGAEGGRDDRKKKSVEVEEEEEEEEDVNLRELTILQGIVMAAYEFSLEQAALQLSKLETDIADTITLNTSQVNSNPSSSLIEADTALRKEFRVFASQEAKDFRKMVGTLSFKMAAKIFAKEKLPYLTENCPIDSAIVEYGNKCVELTWYMVIQDPPMMLVCPKHGEKFKKTEFAYHGRTGKIVELCVWPALYLHEGGPLVNKGHVLPIKT